MVMGGIIVDGMPSICDEFLFLRLDGCPQLTFWEESFELLGIWLTLVAMLGHLSDIVPAPRPFVRRVVYMLPFLWIILINLDPLSFAWNSGS